MNTDRASHPSAGTQPLGANLCGGGGCPRSRRALALAERHQDPFVKEGIDTFWKIIISAFAAGSAIASINTAYHWLTRVRKLPIPSEEKYKYYNPFDIDLKRYIRKDLGPVPVSPVHSELLQKLKLESERDAVRMETSLLEKADPISKVTSSKGEDEDEDSEALPNMPNVGVKRGFFDFNPKFRLLDSLTGNYFSNVLRLGFGLGALVLGVSTVSKIQKKFLDKYTEKYTRAYTQAAADAFYKDYADLLLLNKKLREGAFDINTINKLPVGTKRRIRDLLFDYTGLDYSVYLGVQPIAPELRPLTKAELAAINEAEQEGATKLPEISLPEATSEVVSEPEISPEPTSPRPISSMPRKTNRSKSEKSASFFRGLTLPFAALPAISAVSSIVNTMPKLRKADPISVAERSFRKHVDYEADISRVSQKIQNLVELNARRSTNIRLLQELLEPDAKKEEKKEKKPKDEDKEEKGKDKGQKDKQDTEEKIENPRVDVTDTGSMTRVLPGDVRKITPAHLRLYARLLE